MHPTSNVYLLTSSSLLPLRTHFCPRPFTPAALMGLHVRQLDDDTRGGGGGGGGMGRGVGGEGAGGKDSKHQSPLAARLLRAAAADKPPAPPAPPLPPPTPPSPLPTTHSTPPSPLANQVPASTVTASAQQPPPPPGKEVGGGGRGAGERETLEEELRHLTYSIALMQRERDRKLLALARLQ